MVRTLQGPPGPTGRAWLVAPWLLVALLGWGCALPTRMPAVPSELMAEAVVPGMPDVRFWAEGDPEPFRAAAIESVRREMAYLASRGHAGPLPRAYYLAVSGGGEDGAFAAGLLNGWTVRGDRPEFRIVTGVSTGALIAPMAFLGSDYDSALREAYTTISQDDIFVDRPLTAAIFDDALSDTTPMQRLIATIVTPEFLSRIVPEDDPVLVELGLQALCNPIQHVLNRPYRRAP